MRPRRTAPFLVAVAALTLGACATNPVTGKQQVALISEQQEIALGQQGAQQAVAQFGLVQDHELQRYVSAIGTKLAAQSERPQLPWSFAVVDDPTPNAFALPGGPIFVTRGLLALLNSEAELASVLGHEIGHVTARHSVAQISKQQLAQLGLGLGMILAPQLQGLGDLAGQGLQLLFLKYGRDAERQADDLGFRYALQQNYDVREMADVFAALQRATEGQGGGRLPNWAASHPSEPERIAAVQRRVAAAGRSFEGTRSGKDDFLRQIDGLTYGADPRQGFFREGQFHHPELKFQFRVPGDWKTQNSTNAVIAVSPRQDAAFQLTLVPGETSPEQAAQQFARQQGLQAQAAREEFNGLPGVLAAFQAQTPQGTVEGYAAFVRHGGRTYQLVGYSPQPEFANNDRTFRQILGSFGPLNDSRILNVQARRLHVATLGSATTAADFARRESPGITPEQFAVLNQIDDPNARLPAGALVKVVRGDRP
ncbi:MAG: M48 family metalloprotease [Steroidobacteraceae bacterium]|nr:M48 family metalloprotease [Steroidobacteraceae bacterium]